MPCMYCLPPLGESVIVVDAVGGCFMSYIGDYVDCWAAPLDAGFRVVSLSLSVAFLSFPVVHYISRLAAVSVFVHATVFLLVFLFPAIFFSFASFFLRFLPHV